MSRAESVNSGRNAALVVTFSGGFISLVLASMFALIASSVSEDNGVLWTLFGVCVYMLLISVACTYLILSRAGRPRLLLAAILMVLPCVLVSFVAGVSGSWAVLFIPIFIALAFVLVGVILTWRVRP